MYLSYTKLHSFFWDVIFVLFSLVLFIFIFIFIYYAFRNLNKYLKVSILSKFYEHDL